MAGRDDYPIIYKPGQPIEKLDHPPTCANPNCTDLTHPFATHTTTFIPCGCTVLICDGCAEAHVSLTKRRSKRKFRCMFCYQKFGWARYRDITRIEALS